MSLLHATPGRSQQSGAQALDFQLVGLCLIGLALFAVYPLPYLCVIVPAILSLYLWLRAGAVGIPTLPIVAALSIVYYAAPELRGDLQTNDTDRILAAALAVGAFLSSAAAIYQLFLIASARRATRIHEPRSDQRTIVELTFLCLGGGGVFYISMFTGLFDDVGTYFGIVRAVGLTFASIGCYLAGAARAQGLLRGGSWALALTGVAVNGAGSMAGLLMVGAVAAVLAVILGYVIVKRRIPWITLALAFALVSVLQAGKSEIRERYWNPDQVASYSQLPTIIGDWIVSGVEVVWSGTQRIDVLERASLLWTVIRVQELTPEAVPYLDGESYMLLPAYLVPRFIDPDKPKSQAGLNLLAVRYGLQTEEDTERTTIAFGLVAEAYANFGSWGLLAIGGIFGAICGIITWFSTGVSLISVRMFIAIAAMTVLLDVEADLAYMLVTIFQAVAGVLIAAAVLALAKGVMRVNSVPGVTRRAGTAAE
ncbi:MAG TPA: hypothetical protein VM782_16565 [Stellaceae bacterium]|nr:hypothetical protein [Stellaceae bacterium]